MDNPFKESEEKRDELTLEQEKQIKQYYREALQELKKEFIKYSHSNTEYAALKRQQIKQMRDEIRVAISEVDTRIESLVKQNTNVMVSTVLDNNMKYLNELGYNSVINTSSMRISAVESILSGKLYDGKWNLSSAIWGDNKATIKEINKLIAKGVMEQKSVYEIAKSVEKYVNPNVINMQKYPGFRKKIDYNAQRLARTTIQHAYQKAFVDATLHNPFIEAYRWVTSGGHNVCTLCVERETEDHYGLGEGIFPKDKLPLDHPNGNCTFEVVITMSDMEISDAIADWYLGEGDPKMNEQIDEYIKSLSK